MKCNMMWRKSQICYISGALDYEKLKNNTKPNVYTMALTAQVAERVWYFMLD